jgi:hypothetical protein
MDTSSANEAPPHFWIPVTEFLNEQFTGMWIGQGGPILCSPRLPDFTPFEFFLWEHIKNISFETKVNELRDLWSL